LIRSPDPSRDVENERDTAVSHDQCSLVLAVPPRYRLIRRRYSTNISLGWDAEDRQSGALVFLKASRDADDIRRETKIVEAISHPSVPKLIEWGLVPDGAFLVLTSAGSIDLETYLLNRGGKESAAIVTALMRAIALTLDAVHGAGFIHRDLKPANIALGDDLTPSIVDFSAAAPLDQHESWEHLSQLTHGYAGPEQYLKDAVEGPWTDIYALAAIAYRALFGRPPPPALARRSGEAVLSLAHDDSDDDVTQTLLAAIEHGLALDPGQRPSEAKIWAGRLLAKSGASSPTPLPSGPFDDEDAYPPTVAVERIESWPLGGDAQTHADKPQTPEQPGRNLTWILTRVMIGAVVAGAIVTLGLWQGRPLYERYVKREWLVDVHGSGDALSISDALRRGAPDAQFAIAPGVYDDNVRVDAAQHLLAADPASPPVIAPASGTCLIASGNGAVIEGLSFTPASGPDPETPKGCVILRGTNITFVNNRISDGPGPGIVVTMGSRAHISSNELSVNTGRSIIIRGGAEPQISDNILRNGGVVFAEGAHGALVANRIVQSSGSAVEIGSGARPEVRDNVIEAAAEAGVYVYDGGGGRVMNNRISESGLSGAVISGGGTVEFVGNEVVGSKEHGVLVLGPVGGVIERNMVRDSERHGIVLGPEANVADGENTLNGNAEPQVFDGRVQ